MQKADHTLGDSVREIRRGHGNMCRTEHCERVLINFLARLGA